jgi:hypothetical protein
MNRLLNRGLDIVCWIALGVVVLAAGVLLLAPSQAELLAAGAQRMGVVTTELAVRLNRLIWAALAMAASLGLGLAGLTHFFRALDSRRGVAGKSTRRWPERAIWALAVVVCAVIGWRLPEGVFFEVAGPVERFGSDAVRFVVSAFGSLTVGLGALAVAAVAMWLVWRLRRFSWVREVDRVNASLPR